jgi:acyl-CoA thioesterase FadM
MHQDRLGFPVVKLEAEFFAPIRYGDEPTVHLGVLRVGTASVAFGFWMTSGESNAPCNRARITKAVVNLDTMRAQPLPDVWRQRFAEFSMHENELPAKPSL